ncbi:hypothetical protein [Nocardia mexicana]|uniref:Excreted virulence factor EspC (Type VII ESX diderm) n=1 Tax=Nocardia mexicana TaxID=279262 RepID=A0A370GLV3_9NOCA|nr:hypothetical protein [Nocardia mexicana]RDI44705.1 hypothetical protein DFR68_11695 [Nocardia mexicana]
MADNLEVDPEKLRDSARLTEEAANRMKAVVGTLRATLASLESDSANQPWGNDKQGKKFADGDKGYKKARTNLLDGGDGATKALFDFADGQRDAATLLRNQEWSNTDTFGRRNA